MSGLFVNIVLVLITIGVLAFLPALAQIITAEEAIDNTLISFIWVMLPAWVYLGGATTMLVLALKHMSGGTLAKPFTLMGIGVLVDALAQIVNSLLLIGLFPTYPLLSQLVFAISTAARFSVVLGMIWIANVFGILKSQ